MLLGVVDGFVSKGFRRGQPYLIIYMDRGHVYQTNMDRKIDNICLCMIRTIIMCLPLSNIQNMYHSIKKDKKHSLPSFHELGINQTPTQIYINNIYIYMYINIQMHIQIHMHMLYIYHTSCCFPLTSADKTFQMPLLSQELGFVMGNHTLSLSPEDMSGSGSW